MQVLCSNQGGTAAGQLADGIVVFSGADPDCCPSGRAATTWSWNGHRFTAGRTTITGR